MWFKFYTRLFTVLFTILMVLQMFIPYFWGVLPLLFPFSMHHSPPPICLRAFPKILVPSKLYWRWWKWLLAVNLPFRDHFHINATDKVGVWHWMQRWKVYHSENFLPPSLPTSLSLLLSWGIHMIQIVLILLFSSGGRSPWSSFTFLGLD